MRRLHSGILAVTVALGACQRANEGAPPEVRASAVPPKEVSEPLGTLGEIRVASPQAFWQASSGSTNVGPALRELTQLQDSELALIALDKPAVGLAVSDAKETAVVWALALKDAGALAGHLGRASDRFRKETNGARTLFVAAKPGAAAQPVTLLVDGGLLLVGKRPGLLTRTAPYLDKLYRTPKPSSSLIHVQLRRAAIHAVLLGQVRMAEQFVQRTLTPKMGKDGLAQALGTRSMFQELATTLENSDAMALEVDVRGHRMQIDLDLELPRGAERPPTKTGSAEPILDLPARAHVGILRWDTSSRDVSQAAFAELLPEPIASQARGFFGDASKRGGDRLLVGLIREEETSFFARVGLDGRASTFTPQTGRASAPIVAAPASQGRNASKSGHEMILAWQLEPNSSTLVAGSNVKPIADYVGAERSLAARAELREEVTRLARPVSFAGFIGDRVFDGGALIMAASADRRAWARITLPTKPLKELLARNAHAHAHAHP